MSVFIRIRDLIAIPIGQDELVSDDPTSGNDLSIVPHRGPDDVLPIERFVFPDVAPEFFFHIEMVE